MNPDEYIEKKFSNTTKLPKNLFISEGNKYMRLLQFDKAISSFEKVIVREPKNVQSILGRAKCYMRLAEYKKAWQDFEKVIQLNPKCTEAVYLKGVTEYLRGDFEKGFLTYWKGYKQNPSRDALRQGYNMCDKAIENNLDANKRMLLTEKDIKGIAALLEEEKLPSLSSKTDYYKTGLFSSNLKLLEDMLSDKNLNRIHLSCKDLFNYYRERQKFWKMQEPHTNANRASSMLYIKNNTCSSFKMNRLIRLCKAALRRGRTEFCIKKSKEVLEMLSDESLYSPKENEIEAEVLHILVMAYLIEEEFSIALKYCEQLLDAATANNMPETKGKAYRDFGEIYYIDKKYKKALQFFKKCPQYVQSDEEMAMILYKVSDCCSHLGNLKDAQKSVQECLNLAVKFDSKRFQFDALLLSAEIAVKGKNIKEAEECYRKALEIAIQNKDERHKDLQCLLELFKEVTRNDSYSNETFEIVQITNSIKNKNKLLLIK